MSFLSRDYTEKRSFIRMQVGSPIELKTESGTCHQGKCIDLSGGGMLVEIDQALEISSHVTASVISGHGHNPTLQAQCSVTRVEQTGKESYFLGLEIQEVLNKPTEDIAETE